MIKRFLPSLLIAAGVMALAVVLGHLLFTQVMDNPGALPLPAEIAGLELTASAAGRPAVDEIKGLHGQSLRLTAGAVGVYGNNQATLWASGTPLPWTARQMVESMTGRIVAGGSPFTPTGTRPVGSRLVYELTGMGQQHFYFQSANRVIWLAADPALAEAALQQALEFYP